MKKLLGILMVLLLSLSLVACNNSTPEPEPTPSGGEDTSDVTSLPTYGKKVAYILNVATSDIFQMAVSGAKETAEALGMTLDVYFTDTDNVKFQDTVNTAANQNYDAMFLSHGNQETAYDLVNMLVEKGIKVICFDTQFVDASGEKVVIDGVTQMFQDDQKMADLLLDYICNDLFAEKVKAGEKVNILKIWRGPGISPFDRRQETYLKYEEQGLINTLEVLGPSDPSNGEASMAQVVASTLPKYAEGTIDAMWCCYDAYARGAYTAITEANRTDFPLVTVDISNQDINYMLDGSGIWKACATVDFTTVGEQGIRILAQKLAGEKTEDVYNLVPSLVKAEDLTSGANVLTLKDIIPGYGVNDDHISDWMEPYLK
jgi:simple sugar transport system substrate-binding protein